MMKYLLAFLLLPFISFIPVDWITVKLDNRTSIDFPAQPVVQDLNGTPYFENENAGEGKCIVMVTDFGKMGMDSATLSESMSRTAALAELRDGLLRDASGSTLLTEKRMKVGNNIAFEYHINTGANKPGHYNRMYYRAIVFKDRLYSLYFYEDAGKPKGEMRKRFFDSFKML
jgi:hypothetical protein